MVEQTMQIDITGSNLQSLMALVQKFPNGLIVCKDNKAYWDFDTQIQQINYQQPNTMGQTQQQPQQKQKGNTFLNMFDAMASYF